MTAIIDRLKRLAKSALTEILEAARDSLRHDDASSWLRARGFITELITEAEKVKDEIDAHIKDNWTAIRWEKKQGATATARVDGWRVRLTEQRKKLPERDGLEALMHKRGFNMNDAFVQVQSWEISPAKIDELIARGAVTEDEIAHLYKSTQALKIDRGGGGGPQEDPPLTYHKHAN